MRNVLKGMMLLLQIRRLCSAHIMGDRFKDPDNRQLRAFLERFDIVALSERMDEGLPSVDCVLNMPFASPRLLPQPPSMCPFASYMWMKVMVV